ncbi:hypothetical protein HN51_029665 [Arachis hypogaea]|uniref:C2H2-type domain-containing protein n=2 Tax=Arachis TaxID=3817 RepID=A0A445BDX2_ARAHY|nr:zinc finger protein ZAT11 [Arachis duranensis]XP_025620928.1 zinc finger protein ZAT11 [Arachis hypogaea]QHO36347.1 Zinc finger protein [Arachis hypogaea]RYR36877.1 hypothetical protein Ahy_A09g041832 [Arachis hypogaea]
MMTWTIKREREPESIAMANYLMLLSGGAGLERTTTTTTSNNRVFECKTCNRQFSSFQALGGHRASHKKPRLMNGEDSSSDDSHGSPAKPKTHECSVCGLEFAIGQALGGHMRRHRTAPPPPPPPPSSDVTSNNKRKREVMFVDLNLTPFENDLAFLKIGQPTITTHPPNLVHCL